MQRKKKRGHQKKDRGQKEEIRGKKDSASEMEGRRLQRKGGEWQGTAWTGISGVTARQRSAHMRVGSQHWQVSE